MEIGLSRACALGPVGTVTERSVSRPGNDDEISCCLGCILLVILEIGFFTYKSQNLTSLTWSYGPPFDSQMDSYLKSYKLDDRV